MTKDKLKELFAVECTETDGKGVTVIKGTPMDIINWINDKLDQETQRLKDELEIVENYNDMLIRELSELKEKHKEDVETAFSEGLFLPHDSDLTAEQYYNETHKTK